MTNAATLHFICGKLASGKTTLAKTIEKQTESVFICEDLWLSRLYPACINNFHDYLKYSSNFRSAIEHHVQNLLSNGVSVVLDFAGNIPSERKWVKALYESSEADHLLHFIDASDRLCKKQLSVRNESDLSVKLEISDEEFDTITSYFQPPLEKEGFRMKLYDVG